MESVWTTHKEVEHPVAEDTHRGSSTSNAERQNLRGVHPGAGEPGPTEDGKVEVDEEDDTEPERIRILGGCGKQCADNGEADGLTDSTASEKRDTTQAIDEEYWEQCACNRDNRSSLLVSTSHISPLKGTTHVSPATQREVYLEVLRNCCRSVGT